MTISRLRAWTVALVACVFMATSACGGGGEARKAEHIAKGEKFMAERNYAKARIEFRNALQIDPNDAQVRALVGLSNERLNEYKDAVNAYRLALSADETLEMPRSRLALLYASAGLSDEAMELVTAGLQIHPRSSGLLTAKAVAVAAKDPGAARLDAEEALRLDPTNADAAGVLASLLWRQGERSEAIALLEKSVSASPDALELRKSLARLLLSEGRATEAEKHLAEVIRLDPGQVDHRFAVGQVYLAQGKVDQALETLRAAVAAHPERVDAKLALAQLLVEHRSFEEGERQMLEYGQQAPKDLELQLAIGRFYEANRRFESAIKTYAVVVKSADDRPQGVTARTRLASMSIRDGKLDDASGFLEEALKMSPRDTEALSLRGDLALRRGNPSAAIIDLRAAQGMQPDSVQIGTALARAYVQSGSKDLAEQTLRGLVQANPGDLEARLALSQFLLESDKSAQAQTILEQLVSEQPYNIAALDGLGRMQLASGDTAAALLTADSLQSLQPKSWLGFRLEGLALEREGKIKEAREAFERAAALEPQSTEPLLALVRLDLLERNPDKGLQRLEQAKAGQPGNPVIEMARGDVLAIMGRWSDAIASFRSVIADDPSSVQAYRGLSNAYMGSGDSEKAIAVLKDGLPATREAPALLLAMAMAYGRMDRDSDAVATYERVLEKQPMNEIAANNLAMILVDRLGDSRSLERAEELAQRFASSRNAGFLDTYGWVMSSRGHHTKAVDALSEALALQPGAVVIRYHLGMAQVRAGQVEDGRKHIEAALAAQPDFPGAERARETLKDL